MLTIDEMMNAIYMRGGEFCDEARQWLLAENEDDEKLVAIEDTFDELRDGEIGVKAALVKIARIIDHSCATTKSCAGCSTAAIRGTAPM